jgi:hypothetical protein
MPEKWKLTVSFNDDTHGDLDDQNKVFFRKKVINRNNMKYPGRLWIYEKLISFWHYPENRKIFDSVIKDLEKTISEDQGRPLVIGDDWQIDVRDEEGHYKLIPITDYHKPKDDNKMDLTPHLMSPEDKKKVLMDQGYRAKKSQWKKWQKPFENLEYFNEKYDNDAEVKHVVDFLDNLKSFSDLTDDKLKEVVEFIGCDGYNNEEDALEDIIYTINDFKTLPNPCILYRIVGVSSENKIDTNKLGQHYTPYKWNLDDGYFQLSIGVADWDEYDEKLEPFVMEVSVNHEDIDYKQTLMQLLAFPREYEINLKNEGRNSTFIKSYKMK